MSGEWIKMRGNLWDDPRVSGLVDMTDAGEAAVIGGLYWLWASADKHSEDGIMLGLTVRGIDRKTGVAGLGAALVSIGWIADHPEGIRIIRFDEHNGASAKKRLETAKRVAKHRGNADVTQPTLQDDEEGVTGALARRRIEEEKNKTKGTKTVSGTSRASDDADAPTHAAELSSVLRGFSISSNPSDPRLIAFAKQGVTASTMQAACETARKAKPNDSLSVGYIASILERWAKEAAALHTHGAREPPRKQQNARDESRAAGAASIGLGAGNHAAGGNESFIDAECHFID